MFTLTIHLPHERRQISVPAERAGQLLTDVLRTAGLPLNTRCGQRGLCDGCLIDLLSGDLRDAATGQPLSTRPADRTLRGCQAVVPESGHAEIRVAARSLLAHQPQVVTSFRLNVPRAHNPLWQRLHVDSSELDSNVPLVESLHRAVAANANSGLPIRASAELQTWNPGEAGTYSVCLQHYGDHWTLDRLELEGPAYGAAIDIGTTTVVVMIVDLDDGRVLATASALNAQTKLGDNVLTRINACMVKPHMTRRLQKAVIHGTLRPLLSEALDDAGVDARQLVCLAIAGNTTMLHLLDGVDPSSMGVAPFTPAFLDHRVIDVGPWDLDLIGSHETPNTEQASAITRESPRGRAGRHVLAHLLPGAAAYVGADITAGVLASGMVYSDETSLLVDLGTNGEIVLRHGNSLIGCATAAGPAFEGAGLTFGMRAGKGAVGHVWLEGEPLRPRIEVIDNAAPQGLCGTAYIDFVARARRAGVINATARFADRDLPGVIKHETHGWAFVVGDGPDNKQILITEADMACLLQAKAAIAAGVTCLLDRTGLTSADVPTVYLAGGFGFHMHVDSLLGCGMLPGFEAQQIEMVGNTALAGAYLALLDSGALGEIKRLSSRMEIVELNLEPHFEMTYIDQLSLPGALAPPAS